MQDEHFVDPSIASPQKFLCFGQLRFCHPAHTMKRSASIPLSTISAHMMKLQVESERSSEDCLVAPAAVVAATSAAGEDMPDLQHGFEEMSVEDAGTGRPKDLCNLAQRTWRHRLSHRVNQPCAGEDAASSRPTHE